MHPTSLRRAQRALAALAATASLALVAPATVSSASPAERPPSAAAQGTAGPERYIVMLEAGDEARGPSARAERVGAVAAEARARGGQIHHVYTSAIEGFAATLPPQALEGLQRNPHVAVIEPDLEVSLDTTQAPTPSWGIDRIDQRDRPLNSSYTYTSNGAGVHAYVIDSGINAGHTDFTGRVVTGRNAVDGSTDTTDCNQHGTHVSGTVGGTTFGVAKGVTIVPVKVFPGCSSSTATSNIIAGLDWVVANHQAGQPAVANLSLGGAASTAMDAAIVRVFNDGVAVAVAAGNNRLNACSYSPARVAQILTVAASDINDAMASFSNGGTCVDLFGPGVSIVSADYATNGGSRTLSGTSMSSPHVAGVLALELATHPGESAQQAQTNVVANATSGRISGTAQSCQLLFFNCRPATPSNRLVFTNY